MDARNGGAGATVVDGDAPGTVEAGRPPMTVVEVAPATVVVVANTGAGCPGRAARSRLAGLLPSAFLCDPPAVHEVRRTTPRSAARAVRRTALSVLRWLLVTFRNRGRSCCRRTAGWLSSCRGARTRPP